MPNVCESDKKWISDTWSRIDAKLSKVAVRSRNKLPYTVDENGVHRERTEGMNWWWTNGFWGGMMWLMYVQTQNPVYMDTAKESVRLVNEIFEEYDHLDHDVGFLWHLTAGADWRITGERKARSANLLAASSLFARFNIDGRYIRAWNDGTWSGIPHSTLTIIDTMMNLAQLYWASEELGDNRFAKVAMAHADMTLRDHIRPDGSVAHQVVHDEVTGDFVCSLPGQGYSADSCWSRGLAWAVYGSVISYVHTKEKRYLDAAIKTANYFLVNSAPYGYLPPADFRAPQECFAYDSTAGACAACGLLEIAKYVSDNEAKIYREGAIKLLRAIDEKCADYSDERDCLTLMGSERCPRDGVDPFAHIPIIYGDFFYVEAFLKLMDNDFFIW